MQLSNKLTDKLNARKNQNALRELKPKEDMIDFSSNDYLGFSNSNDIFFNTHQLLLERNLLHNGATGSRLLSGNHALYPETENLIAAFHNATSALIFNSGYDANVGFFSAVPQRGDLIFYDELIHASIRDGIRMSLAKSYKFRHNNLKDLHDLIERSRNVSKTDDQEIYIVTESVFSMDGDTPDLVALATFCQEYRCYLVVDEAHAVGIFGNKGVGLVQELALEEHVFARIVTFGKALGCHGAVILGSKSLQSYLVNFARSFMYTTGLSPHAVATILCAYSALKETSDISKLQQNIRFFKSQVTENDLQEAFIESHSAIHCCLIPGTVNTKKIASHIQQKGFDVKAILSPTVPLGKERLRFCLHSFNSKEEISEVLRFLATFDLD